MPSPAAPTSVPLPSPPFPSFPFFIQTPFSTLLTSSTQPSSSLPTIPSSLRSLQPRRETQPSLPSFSTTSLGLAGSQTPHCQLAALRAGHRDTTACNRTSSTFRDAFLSPRPPNLCSATVSRFSSSKSFRCRPYPVPHSTILSMAWFSYSSSFLCY